MEALLSYEQAAACFPGKGVRWVRDCLVKGRRVDSVRIGGSGFIVKKSLEAYLALHTTHAFGRFKR